MWYATGTEIAEYYKLYKYTELIYSNNKIMVKCNENISNGELTIELEVEKAKEIFLYNTNERIKLSNIKENKFIGEIKVINNNEYNIEIITN
ncbi:hypothetical protein [Clostridium septicum]|uniref:hypothetical protein n=1 Tax=Clostridium septicum TaxID=1504 RepID=UPI000FF8F63D|nr:hypothetical protein [Clostridium septicum]QAS62035.1 hypothetical protein EI377_15590 [Clostridium septicum]